MIRGSDKVRAIKELVQVLEDDLRKVSSQLNDIRLRQGKVLLLLRELDEITGKIDTFGSPS